MVKDLSILLCLFVFVCSATIAKRLHEDCFALIFGINTLIALILQSLLTFVAITYLNLPLRPQYKLYSYLFFVLTLFYGLLGTSKAILTKRKSCSLAWKSISVTLTMIENAKSQFDTYNRWNPDSKLCTIQK